VNPSLRRWHDTAERERPVGCHVSLGLPRNAVVTRACSASATAANLADPLTGDGIAHALKSGRLAAEAIDGAQSADDARRRWQASYETEIQSEIDRASVLQRLAHADRGQEHRIGRADSPSAAATADSRGRLQRDDVSGIARIDRVPGSGVPRFWVPGSACGFTSART
jgi:hypothetical protein